MSGYVGPTQPITQGGAQENFQQMIDHVLLVLPKATIPLIKRRINHHLRNLQEMRSWAGLMVRGEFHIPEAYSRGAFAVNTGSDRIQGIRTSWPYNDAVSTTLTQAITHAKELQDIYPASMSGINPGDYVKIGREYVLVHGVLDDCFQGIPAAEHPAGAVVTRSSFTGRQFHVPSRRWMYTIRGIDERQRMKLDHEWSSASVSREPYQIVQAYITFPMGLKMLWTAINTAQGWGIRPHITQDYLNRYDSMRHSQGGPTMLVDLTPDEIGRIRYEVYPTPVTEMGIPYMASRFMPDLHDETDAPPPCIPSGIIVDNVIADVMMTNRTSEDYDPVGAREYRRMAAEALGIALMQDDNIYMQNNTWDYSRSGHPVYGAVNAQSHDYEDAWF